MTPEHFHQLLTEAGLQGHQASKDHGIAFSVLLCVPTELKFENGGVVCSTRYISDWLVWQPAEFAQMTPESAKSQIARCKARLEKAARTNHGNTGRYDVSKTKPRSAMRAPVASQKSMNYPAH